MQADIYPDDLQLCVQSVQLHKVVFVGDRTTRFQPPVIQLPVLHPAGHTCTNNTTDFKLNCSDENHKPWTCDMLEMNKTLINVTPLWFHAQKAFHFFFDSPLIVNLLSVYRTSFLMFFSLACFSALQAAWSIHENTQKHTKVKLLTLLYMLLGFFKICMLSAYFRDLCKTSLGHNMFYRIKFKDMIFKKGHMFAKMFIDMLHNFIDLQLY